MPYPHLPVLVDEVLKYLVTNANGIYVDGTVGSGGHSEAIGKKLSSKGRLICLDSDPEAVKLSCKRLSPLGTRVTVKKANYAKLDEVLKGLGLEKVNGIFLDLGMSTYQIEESGRGFSFYRDEPLDMRMDPDGEITARQLVNNLSAKDLEKILRDYGEEKKARRIARTIERARGKQPINSSLQLANLVQSVIPPSYHPRARHPATRTFQALRIAVNKELENLNTLLNNVPPLTAKGGRLVILSYHSLEDRVVKQTMRTWEKGCICPPDLPGCVCGKMPLFKRVNKKGIKPPENEIIDNPRARSATLRAAERV